MRNSLGLALGALVLLLSSGADAAPYKVWLGDYQKVRTGKVHNVWIGTAPFCGGKARDCTKRGWKYLGSSKRGNGKKCMSGKKVKCQRPVYKRVKRYITLDNRYQHHWIGTAPFCGGARSDCSKRKMQYVMSHKKGDGKACSSGKKVLCRFLKPKSDPRFEYRWFGTAPFCRGNARDCRVRVGRFVRKDKRGDGKKCVSGSKVLCKFRKPNYRRYAYRWFGTAPSCSGQPADCSSRGMKLVRRSNRGDGSKCVTGWKVRCQVKKPPAPRAIPRSTANNLRILAYNIYMRPRALFKNGQSKRGALIPHKTANFDVIVFSEAFDGGVWSKLRKALHRQGYRYRTKMIGKGKITKGSFTNGGVIIVSKYPITKVVYKTFGKLCEGSDCLADKGVIYARIRKGKHTHHVFGTHLQAHSHAGAIKVRVKQLRVMRRFIDRQRIPSSDAVLIAGDLNVKRWKPRHFRRMLRILRARAPSIIGHKYTYDAAVNDIISGTGREFLDYVLYSTTHKRPKSATLEARAIKSHRKWREFGFESWYWALSDHYPVLGHFKF